MLNYRAFEKQIESAIFDMAIEVDDKIESHLPEIKNWRIEGLRKIYARLLSEYDKSKLRAEPYQERKKIVDKFEVIEKMVSETKTAKKTRSIDWMEEGDVDEINTKGLLEFIRFHFTRITTYNYEQN